MTPQNINVDEKFLTPARSNHKSHPDPNGPIDRRPVLVGELWENPVTGELGRILELPWQHPEGRLTAELIARAGARVAGEHRHPTLVERFTALEGELSVKINGKTSILHRGESAVIEANLWHDWWNETSRDVRVRLEVTPGLRFAHMIETFWGLARLGHTDRKGMPSLLQLALSAREFSDTIVLRRPPLAMQRVIFGSLSHAVTAIALRTRNCRASRWLRECSEERSLE